MTVCWRTACRSPRRPAASGGFRRFQAKLRRIMLHEARLLWLRLWRRRNGFGTAAVSFGTLLPPVALVAAGPGADGIGPADLADRITALLPALQAAGAVLALPEIAPPMLAEQAVPGLLSCGMITEHDGLLTVTDQGLLNFMAAPVQQWLDADAAKAPHLEFDET